MSDVDRLADWERWIDSDTVGQLSPWEREQAAAIALVLLTKTGAYRGSESDALTDAVAIMQAARFAPPTGDNHHNALACPYCTPERR